jgi:hypothetical protein
MAAGSLIAVLSVASVCAVPIVARAGWTPVQTVLGTTATAMATDLPALAVGGSGRGVVGWVEDEGVGHGVGHQVVVVRVGVRGADCRYRTRAVVRWRELVARALTVASFRPGGLRVARWAPSA